MGVAATLYTFMCINTHTNTYTQVGGALERSGGLELAPWVWLPWLPQLQMALARPGVRHLYLICLCAVSVLCVLLCVHALFLCILGAVCLKHSCSSHLRYNL